MAQVSVVIVTWNSVEVISDCLKSIEAQSLRPGEVVVVDNASSDGTTDLIDREFPYVRVIRNQANLGFSRGCNQGIGLSNGEFVLLLNPDATLSSSYIELTVKSLEADPSAGSVGGKLYLTLSEPKRIDSTGIVLDKAHWHPHDRGHGLLDNGQYNQKEYVFGVTAAAALYRRQMFEECHIEGEIFDEDFFAYYEDVDLAWRAQLFGWRALYVPEAVCYHPRRGHENHSLRVAIRAERNRYLLFLKNERRWTFAEKLAPMITYELGRCAKRLITKPHLLVAVPLALMLAPRIWGKRFSIRKNTKGNPNHIKQFFH